MTDQLVTYKTAKLAKELGFDWECLYQIYEGETEPTFDYIGCNNKDTCVFLAVPTQSSLAKWMREKYKYHVEIWYNFFRAHWEYSLFDLSETYNSMSGKINVKDSITYADTYEEALEAGLYNALEIIKNEKD